MQRTLLMALLGLSFALANGAARAQVAGTTTVGISVTAVQEVAVGWSAKKQIIGHAVYNDAGDKVGRIDDLIVTPDSSVSYAIVGVGGFVGVRRHHVAIPVTLLAQRDGEFLLPGATKEAIKAMPAFDYAD
ncbi:MAG TPA: PRC-barrel domain-containing protein [Burkholderiaceae bacterium]